MKLVIDLILDDLFVDFSKVSAAAASALLSDISSLDLQSYMESGNAGNHQQQHGQSSGQYTDLSQYLASSGDHVNGTGYQHETASFQQQQQQQQHSDSYVYHQHESSAGLGGSFSFDPSPSTPLSSLCSPQHYVQQYHHNHQPDYHNSNSVDTTPGGYQPMLMPAAPSPYTPSPSPVSPAVTANSGLPHMQRFQQQHHHHHQQQQQDTVGFYSTPSFSTHNQSNFMIDCANSVLYNMESGGGGGGWDHAADLTTVATDALPQLMDQDHSEQHHHVTHPMANLTKPVKIKKSRPSRAKKVNSVDDLSDVKKRKNVAAAKKLKRDELDDILTLARGNGGQFVSAMNSTARQSVMLNPKRNGAGLYWNLVRDKQVNRPPVPPSLTANGTGLRQKSRVRVGKDHQCTALPRCKKKEANKERESAVLCWNGYGTGEGGQSMADRVDRLLAWSRSAALAGPKRSEEEVLAIMTHFHGDVQTAKLHLLTQPVEAQPNNWTPDEMAVFQAALLQHGKDFPQVAQHVSFSISII